MLMPTDVAALVLSLVLGLYTLLFLFRIILTWYPQIELNTLPWSIIAWPRSEEHTSELQSLTNLVCRLLLEKKKKTKQNRSEEHTLNHLTVHKTN